jgi:hypothetical protein
MRRANGPIVRVMKYQQWLSIDTFKNRIHLKTVAGPSARKHQFNATLSPGPPLRFGRGYENKWPVWAENQIPIPDRGDHPSEGVVGKHLTFGGSSNTGVVLRQIAKELFFNEPPVAVRRVIVLKPIHHVFKGYMERLTALDVVLTLFCKWQCGGGQQCEGGLSHMPFATEFTSVGKGHCTTTLKSGLNTCTETKSPSSDRRLFHAEHKSDAK